MSFPKRYRLEEPIGRGGMGVVYRAHDTLLDRPVAVKVLANADLGEESPTRLLREAQAAARLNHPNIVNVYDAGEAELPGQAGLTPFIVLELVEGTSLHESRLATLEAMVAVGRQICAALAHAHAHGVIHRDLKPENVMITPDGTAKLMDFGLARSVASRLTSEGVIMGTVFYLAPELALGQAFDGRADLYALGVLLYELAAGRLPFTGDDPVAVISQHLHAPVVPPSTYKAGIPPALDALVVRLMSKRPEDRPASAGEVQAALEGLTSAELVSDSGPAPAGEQLVLDRIARGRLVGRRGELKQLHELWARARQGQAHLVLLSGEPGIGKTRLAREVKVHAQLSGAVVLAGGSYEFEANAPYLPFVEALRAWAEAQPTDRLRDSLGTTAPEVAKLVPEIEARLGPLAPNPPLPPSEERLRLFDNLARFFQSLAAAHGLLIVLDDLHWADQGTLALLHYLLRRLRGARVLFLAAYREVELDRAHPLSAALVEWNRERLATRVALGRLSLDETGRLLAALFGELNVSLELSEAIHRETEGNPFFIEEVVKSLIEQGEIYRVGAGWGRRETAELTIPQSIKDAIGWRLNRLSPACIDVLHMAAALGKVFSFGELAAAVSIDEDQLLDALDEASAAQLTRPEAGESFAFTHDKIREVLYEELNPIRRRRLHQRIGEGLERLYAASPTRAAHVPDIAHHFVQSGDLQKGLTYSLEAAAQARRLFALEEALRYYQQAAESAEALGQTEQLVALYAEMGEVYAERGGFHAAVEHYQRALSGLVPDDSRGRAALKLKIGLVYTQIGDERGLAYLQQAERELDPATQSDELANALAGLGRFHHYRSRHHTAIEFQERARQLAEHQSRPGTLALIYLNLAGAYQHLTQYAQSNHWARQNIALGERTGNLLAMAYGHEFLAENAMGQGHWSAAMEHANRDREIGERIGALDRVAWADFTRTFALFGQGDLLAAQAVGRAGLALAEQVGDERLAVLMGTVLLMVETDLHLHPAGVGPSPWVQRADALNQVFMQGLARHSVAYGHLQRGEWAAAEALYAECVKLYRATDNEVTPLVIGPFPAYAWLGLGRVDEAAAFLADFLAMAHSAEAPHWVGCGQRAQGQVLAAQGQAEAAAAAFDEAVATLEQLGSRLELGRALFQRGRLRQSLGEATAAREDWQRALALFEACGAAWDREQAARTLA